MTSQDLKADKESWRNMSKEELEKEYSPSKWSERLPADKIIWAHVESATGRSKKACKFVPNRLNIPYGSGPKRLLDVFGEDLPKESTIMVYVHGGYWQDMNKDVSALFVEPLYKNGMVVVVVGYEMAPQVSVEAIVEQVRAAISWACNFAKERGSKGIVLSGHSAGGQLITQVLSTTTTEASTGDEKGLTKYKDMIRGAVPLSGVFDMRPLVDTYVNEPLKLTESSAWSLSPMGRVGDMARDWPNLKLLVTVGDHDSPEFQRQSRDYCQRCVEASLKAEYVLVKNADHFSIIEDLAINDFSLTRKIIEFVQSFG